MKIKWMILAALAIAVTPTLALAHPNQGPGTKVRPNLYHDRSPHLHVHDSVAHH